MRVSHRPFRKVGGPALCPCGRGSAREAPRVLFWGGKGFGYPFGGNQHVWMRDSNGRFCGLVNTHVCVLCCGYVVPVAHANDVVSVASLTRGSAVLVRRRSARVRNRRLGMTGDYAAHVMLDGRGRMSRNRVNKSGFEGRVAKR